MLINPNHKKKRKGLADRIKNTIITDEDEHKPEKDLLKKVNTSNFKIIKSESINNKKLPYESEQVVERSSGRSTNQMVKRASDRSTKRSLNREVERPSDRTHSQVVERSSGQEVNRISEQEVERSTDQVPCINGPDFVLEKKPDDLTLEQFQVLHFIYFNRPFKVQSKKGISIGALLNPTMTEPNVRNRIKSLVRKGYIDKPRSINDGIKQGSTCTVKLEKCVSLFGASGIDETDQVVQWSSGREIKRVSEQVVERSSEQPQTSYISSSSFIKLTTTGISKFENETELSYWRECNLTLKKIDNWLIKFPVSEVQILQSLCFAQFDLIYNGKEKIITTKNPVSWFEGALNNLGGVYTKPTNYKTKIELDLEEEEKILQEQSRQLKLLKEKREQNRTIQAELWFLNLPDTEQKELLSREKQLNPKQRRNYDSPLTKIAIKKLYDENA